MAEFFDTSGISYKIEQIIKNCTSNLILVSPFLRLNPRIKEHLEFLDKNIPITIVHGKSNLFPEELNWIKKYSNISRYFLKNLHAKCYMNENEAIITSLNLYEFSEKNNYEMGIYVTKEQDPHLYSPIKNEVDLLINRSIKDGFVEDVKPTKQKKNIKELEIKVESSTKTPSQSKKSKKKVTKSNGTHTPSNSKYLFCIRCKKKVDEENAPFCDYCYEKWEVKSNENQKEKYCLVCSKEHKTTFVKPMCISCFKKNEELYEYLYLN